MLLPVGRAPGATKRRQCLEKAGVRKEETKPLFYGGDSFVPPYLKGG